MNLRSPVAFALLLTSAAFAAGCASTETETPGKSGSSSGTKSTDNDDCGYNATDDCTPHVGPNQRVMVDALVYRLTDSKAVTSIGDKDFLGAQADGVFIVVTVKVHSERQESGTLGTDVFQLQVDGKKYDPDNDGTSAIVGDDTKPFLFEDIGPDSTVKGQVVFDVPKKVLKAHPELRMNELGFGSTHGFIELPKLKVQ